MKLKELSDFYETIIVELCNDNDKMKSKLTVLEVALKRSLTQTEITERQHNLLADRVEHVEGELKKKTILNHALVLSIGVMALGMVALVLL